jgi:predicted RecB family nuclease
MLERLQHTSPAAGKIMGLDGTAHTIKLDKSATVLLPLLAPLQAWTATDTPELPPVILNKHCPLCPFQQSCQAQAEQEDNLSLLHGVTARDIRQYAKKGIFTVKQLSYLFKPRTLIGSRALVAYDDVNGSSTANNRPWSRQCTARLFEGLTPVHVPILSE